MFHERIELERLYVKGIWTFRSLRSEDVTIQDLIKSPAIRRKRPCSSLGYNSEAIDRSETQHQVPKALKRHKARSQDPRGSQQSLRSNSKLKSLQKLDLGFSSRSTLANHFEPQVMSHYKKLSVLNREQKRGQIEPPPDPSKLTFGNTTPQRRQTNEAAPTSSGCKQRSSLFLPPEADEAQIATAPEPDAADPEDSEKDKISGKPFEERRDGNDQRTASTVNDTMQTAPYPTIHPSSLNDANYLHPDRASLLSEAAHCARPRLGPDESIRPGIDEGVIKKNDVIAMLSMGEPLEDLAPVMFRGLFRPAKASLIRLQGTTRGSLKVEVQTLCRPDVYRINFTPTSHEFIGSGYIQGFAPAPSKRKPGSLWAVNRLHATLTELGCGGWFHAFPHLSMIVYPNDSPDWHSLSDQIRPVPAHALLRFVLQAAIPSDVINRVNTATELRPPTPPPLTEPAPTFLQPIDTNIDTTQASDMPTGNQTELNGIMLARFGIDYQMIISHTKDKDMVGCETFFIIYPPNLDGELTIITKFLELNGAKKIFVFLDGRNGQDLGQRNPDWSAFSGLLRDKYPATIIVSFLLRTCTCL